MDKKNKIGESFFSRSELEEAGFASLGENVLIKRNVGIYFPKNLHVGDNVRIDDFCVIASTKEPCYIGSYTHMSTHCSILGSGGFTMEDFSALAPQVTLVTGSDDYSKGSLTNPMVPRDLADVYEARIILRKHVIIGTGSVIMPGVDIGIGSSVGALSLVNKSLKEWGVYFGSPCRKLWDRSKKVLDKESELWEREKS